MTTDASGPGPAAQNDHKDPFAHFVEAQADAYDRAREEIAAGSKTSHWMWFVFPQLQGLGTSAMARRFALADRSEASAFCDHETLGPRLIEASEAMLEWAGTLEAQDILGRVDAMKFRSSMTLFERACAPDDRQVFSDALDGFFNGERCPLTLQRM